MEYGNVPGIDKKISRLVQGTVMLSMDRLVEGFYLLDAVYEMGCTTFDTAHGYGGGDCERTLGRWIMERGIRDDVVVIGKGAHHNRERQRVTPFDIEADLHDSLARQGTGYIDLYLLHRDDPSQPIGPIVEVLNKYKEKGWIHAYGGSNWSTERIQEANDYAEKHGCAPFVASSPNFSLAVQIKPPWPNCISISGPDAAGERAWYREHNMPLFTWSSLAGGFWSGRFTRESIGSLNGAGDRLVIESYCSEENFQRLDRVLQLAAEKEMTVPQIATTYVMNVPLNIFALVGCRTPQEFADNLAASSLQLTEAEIAWLELENNSR